MKKYYLLIFGCQMNEAEGERIDALLEHLNFIRTDQEESADLILVLACSIRQAAVDRIYGRAKRWREWKKQRPLITGLAGCVLPEDETKLRSVFDFSVAANDLHTLPERLREYFAKLPDRPSGRGAFRIAPKYSSAVQAYVPISTGCNNFCTYCVVPYTRGREKSRPVDDVVADVEALLKRGYKEITLLGQNVNSYGLDHLPPRKMEKAGSTDRPHDLFPALLERIAQLPHDFWLRFLSSNPQDMSAELIRVVARERNCAKYIHLPIQSGDDEVLRRMNRRYTVEHFYALANMIREVIPGVAITTDVIVGFCGETKAQFRHTLKVFSELKFDMAYTAQYSHRPGTGAFKAFADDVPVEEKQERERRLTNVLRAGALERNKAVVGQEVIVLIDTRKRDAWYGKTETYKSVKVASNEDLENQFIRARITEALPWGLAGQLLEKNVPAHG